jgi:ADP-ribosyltransferase exoenzyme
MAQWLKYNCADGRWYKLDQDPFIAASPEWGAYWRAMAVDGEMFHNALDGLGLVPVFGEIADGLNAVLYVMEGDLENAALSTVSIVPIAGDVIGKGLKIARSDVIDFLRRVYPDAPDADILKHADLLEGPNKKIRKIGIKSPNPCPLPFGNRSLIEGDPCEALLDIPDMISKIENVYSSLSHVPAVDFKNFVQHLQENIGLAKLVESNADFSGGIFHAWNLAKKNNITLPDDKLLELGTDLTNTNNLAEAFYGNPGLVRAWDALTPSINRTDLDYLNFFEKNAVLLSKSAIVNKGLPIQYPFLKIEDITAIHHYTDSYYLELNKALRGLINMTDHLQGFAKALNNALNKLPNFSGTTYRGTTMKEADVFSKYKAAFDNGQGEIIETAFTSTSRSSSVADSFTDDVLEPDQVNVFFTFNASAGKDVDAFSKYGPNFNNPTYSESEILFKSGETFNVKNFLDGFDTSGNRIIYIELQKL